MAWSTQPCAQQPLCSQGVDSGVPFAPLPCAQPGAAQPHPTECSTHTLASALLRMARWFCFSQLKNKLPLHPEETT